MFLEDLVKFDWDKIKQILKMSEPFKVRVMELQSLGADIVTAKKSSYFFVQKIEKYAARS